MIVKSDYFPLFNDFENNGNIKIEKVLEFFENSGGIHSDLVGNSISKMLENGKSWVLNEWNIQKTAKRNLKLKLGFYRNNRHFIALESTSFVLKMKFI